MRAELHDGPLADLHSDWQQLFLGDPRATPFSAPAWAEAWLAHWAPDLPAWLVTVRDRGELVGLAPLVLHREGPLRLLRTLGENPSDYWDVLALPGRRAAVAAAVADLLAERPGWDALLLTHLPPDSGVGPALRSAGLAVTPRRPDRYPGIELPSSFDDYLGSLPRQRRTNLRRRLRHLDEGELQLREIASEAELPAAVARWQELRVRQWRERGMRLRPEHASARFRPFLVAALGGLLRQGLVAFWELRDGDRLVGSFISFVDSGRFYQYLGGYDPAYAGLGVGKIAIGHGIRTSIEAGRGYYDFLFGAEDYKYWYGARDRLCPTYLFTSGTARSRAASGLFSLRRRRRDRASATEDRP